MVEGASEVFEGLMMLKTIGLLSTFWLSTLCAPAIAGAQRTTVVLVGTGYPRPLPQASGPATAVVVDKRVFLIDAGPGVERQLAAAHLPINGVEALFVTHLHSDHTLGLPDLIFTSWVMGRQAKLAAYGPPGLSMMVDHMIAAFAEDIDVRTHGLEHEPSGGYAVDVHEIKSGVIYDSAGVRVTAIPVPHGIWRYAFGYRFDTPDRSIVISGDTRPSDSLAAASAGVSILVHEVYPESEYQHNAGWAKRPDWLKYMRQFHTSDSELGALASHARPQLLIMSHIVRSETTADSTLVSGVRSGGFTGRVVVGHDLDRY